MTTGERKLAFQQWCLVFQGLLLGIVAPPAMPQGRTLRSGKGPMRDNDTDSERERCGSPLVGADDGVSDTVAWRTVHRESQLGNAKLYCRRTHGLSENAPTNDAEILVDAACRMVMRLMRVTGDTCVGAWLSAGPVA